VKPLRKVRYVVHLIYRSKNYESSSKDYDFSRVGMVDTGTLACATFICRCPTRIGWSGRNPRAMMTYDLTGEGTKNPTANRSK